MMNSKQLSEVESKTQNIQKMFDEETTLHQQVRNEPQISKNVQKLEILKETGLNDTEVENVDIVEVGINSESENADSHTKIKNPQNRKPETLKQKNTNPDNTSPNNTESDYQEITEPSETYFIQDPENQNPSPYLGYSKNQSLNKIPSHCKIECKNRDSVIEITQDPQLVSGLNTAIAKFQHFVNLAAFLCAKLEISPPSTYSVCSEKNKMVKVCLK